MIPTPPPPSRPALFALPLLLAALAAAPTAAAVPTEMSVQGFVRDAAGEPADGTYDITFTLYDDESGTEVLWAETIPGIDVDGGLFDVVLGANAFNPLVSDHFAKNPQVWLGVAVEAGPGVPEEGEAELPRRRLTTVGFAFAAQHAAVADTLACSKCVGLSSLDFDPVTQSELSQVIAAFQVSIPTSVDGLSGGTIEGDVTVAGALRRGDHLVCDASGNCGPTLADVACGVDQVLRYDGEGWVCSDLAAVVLPAAPCDGPNQVVQWDGGAWKCVNAKAAGPSAGAANGFEVTDAWGYTFDGVQRAARTWQDATAACAAAGARLPTATELVRNNATTGTGNLSDDKADGTLWTLLPTHVAAERVQVRLSDGKVSYALESKASPFRCVWPDHESGVFDGDHCNGPPGESCKAWNLFWNVDRVDRVPLPWVAASSECAFLNASIPGGADLEPLIHEGLENPTNQWLWIADAKYWHAGGYGLGIAKWTANPEPAWAYTTGTYGALDWASVPHAFRCLGKRSPSFGTFPSIPACEGDCFSLDKRQARILADGAPRVAANYATAAETCRLLGGSLPHVGEVTDLIHAGWLAGSADDWLWSSDPEYWYLGGYGYLRFRHGGLEGIRWHPAPATLVVTTAPNLSTYRCVWHEVLEAEPTVCGPDEDQVWSGSGFVCAASKDGDAKGAANPGGLQLVDAWGDAWDILQRPATKLADAAAACKALEGRLPTPTEVWRVRANQTLVDSIGDENSTSQIWTVRLDHDVTKQITIRVSDGTTASAGPAEDRPYRCIWPSSQGTALGGRSCYGPPEAPCFQTGHLRTDVFDRPALPEPAAAIECGFYGGRIADVDQTLELVHAGAPNGSNAWLWLAEPVEWFDGNYNYGYAVGRWNGTGTPDWAFQSDAWGAISAKGAYRPFRCVFHDRLE